eukprot:1350340-Amphidinium_carterae.1
MMCEMNKPDSPPNPSAIQNGHFLDGSSGQRVSLLLGMRQMVSNSLFPKTLRHLPPSRSSAKGTRGEGG